jgi:hypothetical protein
VSIRNEGSVLGARGPGHETSSASVRPSFRIDSAIEPKMLWSPVHGRPMQCALARTVSSAWTNG